MAINFPNSPTTGQIFTSGSTSWIYDGVKWGLNTNIAVSNDSMPVGAILWYANTSTAPLGWIAADGSAVSRTTYATLFAVIGTTYGSGDGSTTFNVPSVAATTGKYYIRYTTSLVILLVIFALMVLLCRVLVMQTCLVLLVQRMVLVMVLRRLIFLI
jgi:hypothetical protein